MKKEYQVLGGMAGSSMDGLDLALVTFKKDGQSWQFEIVKTETIAYPKEVYENLKSSTGSSSIEQHRIDEEFGYWIADQINYFLPVNNVDLLAIHGHTVIHTPEKGISWQLGSGEIIAKMTDIKTVTAFRSEDVKLNGQGAPLVPLGDFELFGQYDACLNLGGIANVSLKESKIAGDICPCNQVLNFYAEQVGQAYDDGGKMGRNGYVDLDFLSRLNAISYFKKPFPKSLPNQFLPRDLLASVNSLTGLKSYALFVAEQVAILLSDMDTNNKRLLITGGGAFNGYLVELISEKLSMWDIDIPSEEIISYKEAIIFGFLGLKKFLGEINVLSSVTGAKHDTSSGVIHLP